MLFGKCFSKSITPIPAKSSGLIPKSKCNCLDMMIIPIAASIPCTAAEGNKSAYLPSFRSPITIWITPATAIVATAIFQPVSPPPNAATAPAPMEISPAAGPLTDSLEPAKKLTTIPPIIAETTPKIGGKSAALATPILNGNANKNTKNPASASLVKFSLRPAKPSAGILFELIVKIYL